MVTLGAYKCTSSPIFNLVDITQKTPPPRIKRQEQEAQATIVINFIITIVWIIKFITKKGKSTLHITKQNRNNDTNKYTCYSKDEPGGGGEFIAIITNIFLISILADIISGSIFAEGKRTIVLWKTANSVKRTIHNSVCINYTART